MVYRRRYTRRRYARRGRLSRFNRVYPGGVRRLRRARTSGGYRKVGGKFSTSRVVDVDGRKRYTRAQLRRGGHPAFRAPTREGRDSFMARYAVKPLIGYAQRKAREMQQPIGDYLKAKGRAWRDNFIKEAFKEFAMAKAF